jgi:hypothetical protein
MSIAYQLGGNLELRDAEVKRNEKETRPTWQACSLAAKKSPGRTSRAYRNERTIRFIKCRDRTPNQTASLGTDTVMNFMIRHGCASSRVIIEATKYNMRSKQDITPKINEKDV